MAQHVAPYAVVNTPVLDRSGSFLPPGSITRIIPFSWFALPDYRPAMKKLCTLLARASIMRTMYRPSLRSAIGIASDPLPRTDRTTRPVASSNKASITSGDVDEISKWSLFIATRGVPPP